MSDIRTRQIEANGLAFAVDEAGDGDDVALLLHGFPESRRSWRRQLPYLAGQGWRAVAPDLRGYGQSSRPTGRSAYRLDHLTADVGGLFDALGARRRLLTGHDWGGIIAWAAAIQRVRPLDGLVIMNAPHPAAYARLVRRSPAQMLRSWYAAFFQIPWLPEAAMAAGGARAIERAFAEAAAKPGALSADDLQAYRDNALQPGALTAMINYHRANAMTLASADRTLARSIEVPTLLVWGEQDPFLALELTALNGPYVADLTVRRLAHVSHWVQQEAADAVNAALGDWMTAKGLA